jgi:hypothetical protein
MLLEDAGEGLRLINADAIMEEIYRQYGPIAGGYCRDVSRIRRGYRLFVIGLLTCTWGGRQR